MAKWEFETGRRVVADAEIVGSKFAAAESRLINLSVETPSLSFSIAVHDFDH